MTEETSSAAARLWDKGETLHPDILRFTVGDDPARDRRLAPADCLVNLAWLEALVGVSLLTADEARALAGTLRELYRQARAGQLEIRPEDEDVHTAVERALTERHGDLGKKIHAARSRNDQVATDVRIFAKEGLIGVGDAAVALARALTVKARAHATLPMPGHTHLRPAMPSSVGFFMAAHADGIREDLAALRDVMRALDHCPLGTGAGYGVAVAIDRRALAKRLGFRRIQRNPLAAQTSRGKTEARVLAALAALGNDMARLAWDLALFTAPEYGFFRLPASCATGSSIMPQKRNPDVFEITRGRAAQVRSALSFCLDVSGGLPSGYHRDLQLTKGALIDALDSIAETANVLALTVTALEPIEERCRAGMTPELGTATEALRRAAAGTPFREAYRDVAADLAAGRDGWSVDPADQISHGAPGNLDLDGLDTEIEHEHEWFQKQARDLETAFAALVEEE